MRIVFTDINRFKRKERKRVIYDEQKELNRIRNEMSEYSAILHVLPFCRYDNK